MRDRRTDRTGCPDRKLVPDLNPLESRLLLSQSQKLNFPDGTSLVVPLFRLLPRTGGVSLQLGSVLGVGVGQPTSNTVQVTDQAQGNFTAEWNGGPIHSFTGIKSTVIQTRRATSDQVTINLIPPRTSPTAIAVGSAVPLDAGSASERAHPLRIRRTSGTAVQTGSVLTVTVSRPTTNTVELSNEGVRAVAVEWNGRPAHSFTGVETIVVDTHNARKNLIALDDFS
jgi:hypothetical protein